MAETTQLELVTPARIMAQKSVQMVVAPGVEGLFGVLPRHAPLLADLTRGIVEVHEDGKVTDRFMIDGGLADVSGESVTILAERAIDLGSVDIYVFILAGKSKRHPFLLLTLILAMP